MKKIMTIFGTRPEGIKMAPLVNELKKTKNIECIVVNTAQHREMLDQILDLFSIVPDYDFNIMKPGQTPESVTSEIIQHLQLVLEQEKPDLVLVHGDTTTTFASAYAAFLKHIPVGHVEAGLRTFNMSSPFPEEMNRTLVGKLATLHFSATTSNRDNLLREGISPEHIFVVGNTVIDALMEVTTNTDVSFDDSLSPYVSEKFLLVTTHRRENLEQLGEVYHAINRLLDAHPDLHVIFPVHKNPIVRNKVKEELKDNARVHIVEPMDYPHFAHLMKQATLILTDSGGIQEEAPALGKPVLVARDTTERPEGVTAGTLKLVGLDADVIFQEAHRLLSDAGAYDQMSTIQNPYGDGTTSTQIVSHIQNWLQSQK